MKPKPGPKPKPRSRVALAEPDEALLGYLQTLLDEIPEEPETAVAERPAIAQVQLEVAPPVVETVPEPGIQAAPAAETGAQEAAPPELTLEPFQALSFEAAGAKFSLPLLDMKSIVPLTGPLTQLPGHPDWHLGVLLVRGDKVGVVDLARLLHGASVASGAEAAYVLMLDDGRWGLACQRLGNAFRVDPENVRWRQSRAGPRYIRGVLRDSMTPLLSTAEILERLGGVDP